MRPREQGYHQLFLPTDETVATERCGLDAPISICTTSKSPVADYYHVPFSNPYSHKLFGLASRAIEEVQPDVLFGWYFEPYAVLSTILGRLYNLPVVVKHAGSDVRPPVVPTRAAVSL